MVKYVDLIDRKAAIEALRKAYFDKNIQSARKDPCIVDAVTDWAIRQIKYLPAYVIKEDENDGTVCGLQSQSGVNGEGGFEMGMIVITNMESLPEHCYKCPCHDGESGYCQADKERRYSDYRPYWCPLKEIHDDQERR